MLWLLFSPCLSSEIYLFPRSIFCSSFSFFFNNFAHCLHRSRFLSLTLPLPLPLPLSQSLYLSLDFTSCSSIFLPSSISVKIVRSISPYSVSKLFAKSSSHPRSHSLSRNHFCISFLFRFLSVISVYPSQYPFFFGITYYSRVSLCICRLLASILPFLSSAFPPLFIFFFISKIQFSLLLISSRVSLYLSRSLLLSFSRNRIASFSFFHFSSSLSQSPSRAHPFPSLSILIFSFLLLTKPSSSSVFFLFVTLSSPSHAFTILMALL